MAGAVAVFITLTTPPGEIKGPKGEAAGASVILENDRVKGNGKGVLLVEYGDFQCPGCGSYYPLIKELSKEFGDGLTVVFRHFPLTSIHFQAWPAATAAEAANRQGKFWEMHDKLFEQQKEWSGNADAKKIFEGYSKELGLDTQKFVADYDSREIADKIKADVDSGRKLQVTGTPTFFVNGEKIRLPGTYDEFRNIIEAATSKNTVAPVSNDVHEHADILVVKDGLKIDFSKPEYQEQDPEVHFHDNYGEVFHVHADKQTVGDLLNSLNLGLDDSSPLWVNGNKQTGSWKSYEISDLDRIVIVSGTITAQQEAKWLPQVTDKACIYSEKCPERGKPPTENCVGGLGTGCEEKREE